MTCYLIVDEVLRLFVLFTGSDGQQQCLLVTSEVAEAMEAATEQPEQAQPEVPAAEMSDSITEPLSIKTDADTNDQVVAQVVRAEPPSPGKKYHFINTINNFFKRNCLTNVKLSIVYGVQKGEEVCVSALAV